MRKTKGDEMDVRKTKGDGLGVRKPTGDAMDERKPDGGRVEKSDVLSFAWILMDTGSDILSKTISQ